MSVSNSTVEYRDIPGFPGYRVGDDGSVWSCRRRITVPGLRGAISGTGEWKELKLRANEGGYYYFTVRDVDRKRHALRVHKLVLTLFAGPCPVGKEACHNNGVKTDNRLVNLRWGTKLENAQDKLAHGTAPIGSRNGNSRLSARDAQAIRDEYDAGESSYRILAKKYGVTFAHIGRIVNGTRWEGCP